MKKTELFANQYINTLLNRKIRAITLFNSRTLRGELFKLLICHKQTEKMTLKLYRLIYGHKIQSYQKCFKDLRNTFSVKKNRLHLTTETLKQKR